MKLQWLFSSSLLAALLILQACALPAATPIPPREPGITSTPTATEVPTRTLLPSPTAAPSRTPPRAATAARQPTAFSSPTTPPVGTTMPPPPELNYEEQQSFSPPPPSNLHATVSNGAVQLDWQPPPPVTTPHAYSEKVIYYKVYRGTDPAHPDFIGRATGLTFTDRTPSPGVKYYYIVTAVHEGEIESSRGNAVSVTVGK